MGHGFSSDNAAEITPTNQREMHGAVFRFDDPDLTSDEEGQGAAHRSRNGGEPLAFTSFAEDEWASDDERLRTPVPQNQSYDVSTLL